MAVPIRVLFICTHNSARSQIAEGLLNSLGKGVFEADSAGTEATAVRPEAVAVMEEIGIDIREAESKTFHRFLDEVIDFVVTVCDDAKEVCPVFPHEGRRIHWSIPDPSKVVGSAKARLIAFRRTREEIRERIEAEFLSRGPIKG
jgi:arsenate reductase